MHNLKPGKFYPVLVRTLGDVKAAILLSSIIDKPRPFPSTTKELVEETGLSGGDIAKARTRLEAFGILSCKRTSAGHIIYVNQDALDKHVEAGLVQSCIVDNTPIVVTTIRDPADHGLPLAPSTPIAASFADILAGKYDGSKITTPLAQALLNKWCEVWSIRNNTAKVTPQRMTVLRRAVADGIALSMFAKAMLGMRHDEWPDRIKYNEWHHITRSITKWIALYDEHGETKAASTTETRLVVTKTGVKLRVPSDYQWNDSDDFMANKGYKFDNATRSWVRP